MCLYLETGPLERWKAIKVEALVDKIGVPKNKTSEAGKIA